MQIIEDRRRLHAIPELDRDLPETIAYVKSALSSLGCQILSPMPGAVCARFDFGAQRDLAFRADMDALPILEQTCLPYASRHEGKMHACGHDGHMAILLELARRISRKSALRHNILLVFQPAEETTGGARDLCDTGIFANTEAIFGLHLWPGLDAGTVASRCGPMMSRSREVTVKLTGRSAHIAKWQEGVDALAAGVLFYNRLEEVQKSVTEPHVLRFGKMESGTVRNAVSGETTLYGTLRTFSKDDDLLELLAKVGASVERDTGCGVRITFSEGYPPVRNPESLYRRVRQIVAFRELPDPTLITEDFSWYQQRMPGMFFFLGTGDTPALHADTFQFDEHILIKGADFFETLAEELI